jgi:hypothetical protein
MPAQFISAIHFLCTLRKLIAAYIRDSWRSRHYCQRLPLAIDLGNGHGTSKIYTHNLSSSIAGTPRAR